MIEKLLTNENSPFEGGRGDVKAAGAISDIPLDPPSEGEWKRYAVFANSL